MCSGNPVVLGHSVATGTVSATALQVHKRCGVKLHFLDDRKMGIMRCLDLPGASHGVLAPRQATRRQCSPAARTHTLCPAALATACAGTTLLLHIHETRSAARSAPCRCSWQCSLSGQAWMWTESSPQTQRRRRCTSPPGERTCRSLQSPGHMLCGRQAWASKPQRPQVTVLLGLGGRWQECVQHTSIQQWRGHVKAIAIPLDKGIARGRSPSDTSCAAAATPSSCAKIRSSTLTGASWATHGLSSGRTSSTWRHTAKREALMRQAVNATSPTVPTNGRGDGANASQHRGSKQPSPASLCRQQLLNSSFCSRRHHSLPCHQVVGFVPTGWMYEMNKTAYPVRKKEACQARLSFASLVPALPTSLVMHAIWQPGCKSQRRVSRQDAMLAVPDACRGGKEISTRQRHCHSRQGVQCSVVAVPCQLAPTNPQLLEIHCRAPRWVLLRSFARDVTGVIIPQAPVTEGSCLLIPAGAPGAILGAQQLR